jgi:hypothetical protein
MEQLLDARMQAARGYTQKRDADYMREKRDLKRQERERAMNWGDDAVKGAQMGSSFGPYGALIGGIVGTAKGMGRAVQRRRGEGQSLLKALGRTAFDVQGSLPSQLTGAGAGSEIASNMERARQRRGRRQGAQQYQDYLQAVRDRMHDQQAPDVGPSSNEYGLYDPFRST